MQSCRLAAPWLIAITLVACGGAAVPPGGEAPDETRAADASVPAATDPAPSDDAAAPATDGAPPPQDGPMPAAGAGCGRPAAFAAGKQTGVKIMANGKLRSFDVAYPKGYDPSRRYPLLFFFHELGVSTTNHKSLTWTATAVTEKIDVYPAPVDTTWMGHNADDLPFFDAMLAWLDGNACVDRAQVYLTGLSSGAYFAGTLGCKRGNVVRAIAPAAGGLRDIMDCTGGAVAGMFIQGEMNPTRTPDMMKLRDWYLKRNGCDATRTEPAGAPYPDFCTRYTGCPAAAPVLWCLDPAAGHWWPDWAFQAAWAFFTTLPRTP